MRPPPPPNRPGPPKEPHAPRVAVLVSTGTARRTVPVRVEPGAFRIPFFRQLFPGAELRPPFTGACPQQVDMLASWERRIGTFTPLPRSFFRFDLSKRGPRPRAVDKPLPIAGTNRSPDHRIERLKGASGASSRAACLSASPCSAPRATCSTSRAPQYGLQTPSKTSRRRARRPIGDADVEGRGVRG